METFAPESSKLLLEKLSDSNITKIKTGASLYFPKSNSPSQELSAITKKYEAKKEQSNPVQISESKKAVSVGTGRLKSREEEFLAKYRQNRIHSSNQDSRQRGRHTAESKKTTRTFVNELEGKWKANPSSDALFTSIDYRWNNILSSRARNTEREKNHIYDAFSPSNLQINTNAWSYPDFQSFLHSEHALPADNKFFKHNLKLRNKMNLIQNDAKSFIKPSLYYPPKSTERSRDELERITQLKHNLFQHFSTPQSFVQTQPPNYDLPFQKVNPPQRERQFQFEQTPKNEERSGSNLDFEKKFRDIKNELLLKKQRNYDHDNLKKSFLKIDTDVDFDFEAMSKAMTPKSDKGSQIIRQFYHHISPPRYSLLLTDTAKSKPITANKVYFTA